MRKKRDEQYVTIKTVANHANVSTATVSRVINGGNVKGERKRRVLDAINELNYTPNNSARNLASVKATKRVCLVIPYLTSSYIDLIKGFKEGLKIYKYEGIIEEFFGDENKYEEILDTIERTSEVKGIIQFAPQKKLLNKVIVNLIFDEFNIEVSKNYANKKIGIYIPEDKYMEEFFLKEIFLESKRYYNSEKEGFDIVITEKLDEALKLHNEGYNGEIKTIEKGREITQIFPNIESLNFDMYKLGLLVSRDIIKKITDVDSEIIKIEIN